jgi:hypothetical protein
LQYVIISNWLTLKKSILASIAAICLSGNALAAPPADFLSDIRTARQAIEHEMARRMDPGKGKPILLDQPSTQQPTDVEKAALRTVFGSEQPLIVKRTGAVGKATHYSATLPTVQYRAGDTQITWPDASWEYSVNGDTVDHAIRWGYFDVLRPDFHIIFININTDGRQTRGANVHQQQAQAAIIQFQETKGSGSAQASAVKLREQTSEKNKKLEQHIEFSTERLGFGNGVLLNDLHLDMRLRGLNASLWQQLNDVTEADQDKFIRTLMRPLMLQGARLELDDLSASFGGGTLRLRGDIGMPGVKPRDLSTVEGAFNAVEAHLHVELPLATLRSFAMVATHHKLESDGEQVLDAQAQATYSYLLGKIIADGYARLEKDKLIAEIEVKRGQITINGRAQPYSLIQLLAMLHKKNQAPPEEDHSLPTALLWRDRPLEQVQLFGVNGDRFAINELCRRYGQDKDTEQAQRWCAKADVAQQETAPELKDNTLHNSVEPGRYSLKYFHFDAGKTRSMTIKQSNPQAHETWAPSMTVCISADVPSDRACLSFAKYAGVDRVHVSSRLYSADDRALSKEQVLEQQLPLGEPVKLKIYVDDKQAHFLLAGKELAEDVVFPASVISLICSSGDCDFTFD